MKNNKDEKFAMEKIEQKVEEIVEEKIGEAKQAVENIQGVINEPEQPTKRNNFLLSFLLLFFIVSTAAAAYFGYNFMMLQKELNSKEEIVEDNKGEDTEKMANNEGSNQDNPVGMEAGVDDDVEDGDEDIEISEVDEIWNQYTNRGLGFRMNFPKESSYYYGDCEMVDDSYRPVAADVTNSIFTVDNGVYIHPEYRYDLLEPETVDGRTNYGDCQRLETDLDYLEDEDNRNLSWFVEVTTVEDEDELLEFIQDKYGDGCSVGDEIPTDDEDVLELTVATDGLPMEESQCVMNYMYEIRYVPEMNKVFSWNIGQSCNFPADESYTECYDQGMSDSFEVTLEQ